MTPVARALVALAVTAALFAALVWWTPANLYLWLKAAHVVAVIAWMVGILYLPRLFVYHAGVAPGSPQSATFKVMEWRLIAIIINPAMGLTWALGLWLAWDSGFHRAHWLQAKFVLVVLLSGLHGYLVRSARAFAADRNTRSARHWRIVNEIPAVLMVLIVILAIVKPF